MQLLFSPFFLGSTLYPCSICPPTHLLSSFELRRLSCPLSLAFSKVRLAYFKNCHRFLLTILWFQVSCPYLSSFNSRPSLGTLKHTNELLWTDDFSLRFWAFVFVNQLYMRLLCSGINCFMQIPPSISRVILLLLLLLICDVKLLLSYIPLLYADE